MFFGDCKPADVAVRSAAGTGSRFLSQALNISLLCTASPGGCPLCRLSKKTVSANRKAVSANGESVSRNGENPGKQHQVTGKSIPLGRKSDIS